MRPTCNIIVLSFIDVSRADDGVLAFPFSGFVYLVVGYLSSPRIGNSSLRCGKLELSAQKMPRARWPIKLSRFCQ